MIIRAALGAIALAWAPPALAEETFSGEYAISFLGLTIARSTFSSRFDGAEFNVKGTVRAAGLAVLFDDTQGTISTAGQFARGMPQARAFRVDYTEGKSAKMTSISFNNGVVTSTTNVPPLKKRGDDWVPLDPSQPRSVTDPLSATLVRAGNDAAVCGRTVHIYDGEMRADLTLRPDPAGAFDVPGYEGQTVTCRLGFTPISGYRKGRRALDYLKNRSEIRIAFAPLGTTGVYAPVYATIGTQIGTLTVRARRLEPAQ